MSFSFLPTFSDIRLPAAVEDDFTEKGFMLMKQPFQTDFFIPMT